MTYKRIVELILNDKIIDMLLDMKRIRWPQQADPLAIGQAVSTLLEDWAKSGKPIKEFIDEEKLQRNRQEGSSHPQTDETRT
jgi:hypothetical protein